MLLKRQDTPIDGQRQCTVLQYFPCIRSYEHLNTICSLTEIERQCDYSENLFYINSMLQPAPKQAGDGQQNRLPAVGIFRLRPRQYPIQVTRSRTFPHGLQSQYNRSRKSMLCKRNSQLKRRAQMSYVKS